MLKPTRIVCQTEVLVGRILMNLGAQEMVEKPGFGKIKKQSMFGDLISRRPCSLLLEWANDTARL